MSKMYKSWYANSSDATKKKFYDKRTKNTSPSYELSKHKHSTKHHGMLFV